MIALFLLIPRCNISSAAGYQNISKSYKTLDGYPSLFMERSRSNNRIAGGYTAQEGEFPSFVGLLGIYRRFSELCSGIAISDRLILTAAHCFDSIEDDAEIKAAPSIYHPDLWELKGVETYIVVKSCRSPMYRMTAVKLPVHDYQILRLKTPIPGMNYSPLVGSEAALGARAIAVGIGMTSNAVEPPLHVDSLQALPVQIVQCSQDELTHICFQSYKPEHVGDTCSGDSGGPVFVRGDKREHVVVGITSFGETACRKGHNGVSYNVNVYKCLEEISDLALQCDS